MDGIARFHELVGAHVEDPAEVVIGIETDRGLFVTALVATGYQLYAVNPMSTSRYRDRHSTSGANLLRSTLREFRHGRVGGGQRGGDRRDGGPDRTARGGARIGF